MYKVSAIISTVFFVLGLLQAKFLKEKVDLKKLIKQTISVFISCLAGITIMQQMTSSINSKTDTTNVFTDNPGW